ncbi:hypothetical protein MTR_0004s0530 [Medicago truncatula]|uniref:Uncharacterized protein n=1 Tax=Medicago truncatula TaxID=3880 RepID=A0A072TVT4_MEDTR|nr:hypothetical protein MTR_0004s0530 [Medicago truncatula]
MNPIIQNSNIPQLQHFELRPWDINFPLLLFDLSSLMAVEDHSQYTMSLPKKSAQNLRECIFLGLEVTPQLFFI